MNTESIHQNDPKRTSVDAPTKVTHTPGPWHWNGVRFIGSDGSEVLCGKKTNILRNRQEINARLIAAAPELLLSLKWAIQLIEKAECDVPEEIHAIIAKAEGK